MMNAIEGGNGRRMGGLYFTANEAKDNKRVSNGDVKIPKMAQTQNEKSRKRGVDAMGDRIRSSWRAVLMEVLRPLKRLLWLARSQVGLTQKWTISLSFPCKVSKWHGSMVILCFGSNEGMNEAWKRKEDTLDLSGIVSIWGSVIKIEEETLKIKRLDRARILSSIIKKYDIALEIMVVVEG
ncbi:hypothetical protein V6N13_110580 [Hibiscus sabdariffa]